MNYFDKNNVLIKAGNTLINSIGEVRKVVLAGDLETLGLVPLIIENWNPNMGVESLENLNLEDWL